MINAFVYLSKLFYIFYRNLLYLCIVERKTMKEELTAKMHSEFSINSAMEREHAVLFAKLSIQSGDMSKEEALKWYKVSESEYNSFDESKPAGQRLPLNR